MWSGCTPLFTAKFYDAQLKLINNSGLLRLKKHFWNFPLALLTRGANILKNATILFHYYGPTSQHSHYLEVFALSNTRPNKAKYSQICQLPHLGAPNMAKWGIPEKILHNAVHTCWPYVSRTPQSQKLIPKLIFARFPHCNYKVKLEMVCRMSFMGL